MVCLFVLKHCVILFECIVLQTNARNESPMNPKSPTSKTSPPPPSSPPAHPQNVPTVSVTNQANPQKQPQQGTAPHHGSYNSINSTHDVGWASFEDEESHGMSIVTKFLYPNKHCLFWGTIGIM